MSTPSGSQPNTGASSFGDIGDEMTAPLPEGDTTAPLPGSLAPQIAMPAAPTPATPAPPQPVHAAPVSAAPTPGTSASAPPVDASPAPVQAMQPEPRMPPSMPANTPVGAPANAANTGPRVRRSMWHVAQGVMTLGAGLFAYAAWATWAEGVTTVSVKVSNGVSTICGAHDVGCTVRTGLVYLNPGEIGAPPLVGLWGAQGAFFAWSVLTVVGLLLCPFLWQAARPWLSRAALALYTLWALGMTVVTAATARTLTQPFTTLAEHGNTQQLYVFAYNQQIPIESAVIGAGLPLAIVALALVFGGVALSLVTTLFGGAPVSTAQITASLPQNSSGQGGRVVIPGATVVTLGIVLWTWGFFLLPWATRDCNKTPLIFGECYGLPVSSAMQIGIYGAGAALDSYVGYYAIGTLLLLGAAFILGTLWRRAINRTLCVWAAAWVVIAFACALVAAQGASLGVDHPMTYNLGGGVWRGDSGVLVVFIALLVVIVGLVPLTAVAIRRSRLIAASDPDA